MKFHNRRYLFLKFRDIDKMSLCMLFADLRLESTTLGSIDPIPGENIRDGDTYCDGGDYQRGIQAVHAGSHPTCSATRYKHIRALLTSCNHTIFF